MKIQLQNRYRIFSTSIVEENDEVSTNCFALGRHCCRFVGFNPLHDVSNFQNLGKYWEQNLELKSRKNVECNEDFQTFILATPMGRLKLDTIPVDHICAEVNGVIIQLDFADVYCYLAVGNKVTRIYKRGKAFRLFASAIRQNLLKKNTNITP